MGIMKVLSSAVLLLVSFALVESRVVRRDVDEEASLEDAGYFEDDNGSLVRITDETDDETEIVVSDSVFFHLYTQSNPEESQELIIGDAATLASSNWDASKLTRIVTHGWLDSYTSDSCVAMRDAYLTNGDYNVIVIDWSKISKHTYGYSARRVKTVSSYVSQMIDFLEAQGMDLSQTVIAGHSLGAHIAGISSLMATNTVGYVVGLDPAGPYFWFAESGSRIAKGDAAYVQVIHTNAGMLGYSGAIGDIDFYPNGGSSQKGCILDVFGSCAHKRSWKFFAESINSEAGFWGQECDTYKKWQSGTCSSGTTAYMGGNIPTQETQAGSYFLNTASSSAYALGSI